MKKRYLFIFGFLILFSFLLPVYATVETKDRNTTTNYGVNKKWNITDKNKQNVLRTPLVDASEKIYDFADVLTEEEKREIHFMINEFTKKNIMDLVIVTVNLPYTNDKENEDYAADFYDYNDFGIDFEKYNGVLLLRNTYEVDPYYNMYMFGDAQLYFSPTRSDIVLDAIYDDLHNKNYLDGFKTFIAEVDNYSDSIDTNMKDYYVNDMGYLHKKYVFPWIIAILVSGIGTAVIISILVSKNKMIRKAAQASDYLVQDSVNYSIRQDILVGSHTTHYRIDTSSSGGGFSSSSGSSGGGHSSGGGRHG